jgi:membrane protein YdbS with pleckstrin-like domain
VTKIPPTQRDRGAQKHHILPSSRDSGSKAITRIAVEIPFCEAGRIIDLTSYFSIHPYFVLKHSLGWITVGLVCAIAWFLLLLDLIVIFPLNESSYETLSTCLRLGCIVPFFVGWYWREYRRHFRIHLEGFRLVVVRGVFFRSIDSRPLCQISCLSVEQGILGQLLNLFDVKYYCSFGMVKPSFLIFPCLRKDDAFVIEKYLNAQMGRFVSPSSDALKIEAFEDNYLH